MTTPDLIDSVKAAYAAVESNDVETYVTYFTEDALYKVGNFDPVIGHDGIRTLAAPLVDMFTSVTHDIKNFWQVDDVVICEMDITYSRKDGKVAVIPCVDVIRFSGDKVKELLAYLDPTPAFS
jgi:ketosteroid isomerase-like protein